MIEKHAATILNGKRNVAYGMMHPMARLGLTRQQQNDGSKRSIATLAKNGQLPSRETDPNDISENQWNEYKRNIASIAREGILNGKRNIGALARDYVLPSSGKRNLPSILRGGGGATTSSSTHGPQSQPKRNIASIARDNIYPYYHQNKNEKRDALDANDKRKSYVFYIHFYLKFTSRT